MSTVHYTVTLPIFNSFSNNSLVCILQGMQKRLIDLYPQYAEYLVNCEHFEIKLLDIEAMDTQAESIWKVVDTKIPQREFSDFSLQSIYLFNSINTIGAVIEDESNGKLLNHFVQDIYIYLAKMLKQKIPRNTNLFYIPLCVYPENVEITSEDFLNDDAALQIDLRQDPFHLKPMNEVHFIVNFVRYDRWILEKKKEAKSSCNAFCSINGTCFICEGDPHTQGAL